VCRSQAMQLPARRRRLERERTTGSLRNLRSSTSNTDRQGAPGSQSGILSFGGHSAHFRACYSKPTRVVLKLVLPGSGGVEGTFVLIIFVFKRLSEAMRLPMRFLEASASILGELIDMALRLEDPEIWSVPDDQKIWVYGSIIRLETAVDDVAMLKKLGPAFTSAG
jgi:hypothetical protein